jgi:hypothetical protein
MRAPACGEILGGDGDRLAVVGDRRVDEAVREIGEAALGGVGEGEVGGAAPLGVEARELGVRVELADLDVDGAVEVLEQGEGAAHLREEGGAILEEGGEEVAAEGVDELRDLGAGALGELDDDGDQLGVIVGADRRVGASRGERAGLDDRLGELEGEARLDHLDELRKDHALHRDPPSPRLGGLAAIVSGRGVARCGGLVIAIAGRQRARLFAERMCALGERLQAAARALDRPLGLLALPSQAALVVAFAAEALGDGEEEGGAARPRGR